MMHSHCFSFQSTLPARGATIVAPYARLPPGIFQSTLPARGATPAINSIYADSIISIHAPREGSDGFAVAVRAFSNISIHAPREGSDTAVSATKKANMLFQSTLPARGATVRICTQRINLTISIHAPREGSDALWQGGAEMMISISIHAPREGSDMQRQRRYSGL